jgi:hypothetical protein
MIGGIMTSVLSKPKSSTEKAGVPIGDVHRPQLGLPPAPQPMGNRNRTYPMVTTTPVITEARVLVDRSIAIKVSRPRQTE